MQLAENLNHNVLYYIAKSIGVHINLQSRRDMKVNCRADGTWQYEPQSTSRRGYTIESGEK